MTDKTAFGKIKDLVCAANGLDAASAAQLSDAQIVELTRRLLALIRDPLPAAVRRDL